MSDVLFRQYFQEIWMKAAMFYVGRAHYIKKFFSFEYVGAPMRVLFSVRDQWNKIARMHRSIPRICMQIRDMSPSAVAKGLGFARKGPILGRRRDSSSLHSSHRPDALRGNDMLFRFCIHTLGNAKEIQPTFAIMTLMYRLHST